MFDSTQDNHFTDVSTHVPAHHGWRMATVSIDVKFLLGLQLEPRQRMVVMDRPGRIAPLDPAVRTFQPNPSCQLSQE